MENAQDSKKRVKHPVRVTLTPEALSRLASPEVIDDLLLYQLSRLQATAGAMVVPVDEPDPSTHAQTANRFQADVYLGLDARALGGAEINFYAVPSFESVSGRALAARLSVSLKTRGIADQVDLVGRRLPVLRETRMPAVLCTIGPARWVSEQAPSLAGALVDSVCGWIQTQS